MADRSDWKDMPAKRGRLSISSLVKNRRISICTPEQMSETIATLHSGDPEKWYPLTPQDILEIERDASGPTITVRMLTTYLSFMHQGITIRDFKTSGITEARKISDRLYILRTQEVTGIDVWVMVAGVKEKVYFDFWGDYKDIIDAIIECGQRRIEILRAEDNGPVSRAMKKHGARNQSGLEESEDMRP